MKLTIPTICLAIWAAAAGADDAALQSALEQARTELDLTGVAATVIGADGREWTGVAGDAQAGIGVTPATVFETGSVTKLYTAAVVLKLAERGTFGLDDPLARWVPEFDGAETITLRQLLQHTSGVYSIHDDPEFMPLMFTDPARGWTIDDLLARVREPYFEPGTGWRYSNTNFLLLGLVVERATGAPFAQVLRDTVLTPLGLERTWFAANEPPGTPRAHAYIDLDGDDAPDDLTEALPSTALWTSAWTAGAVMTDSRDLARFVHELFAGGLLGPVMRAEMLTFVDRPDGKQYGLGVLREAQDGTVLIGHRGNSMGYSAVAWHAPDSGITFAVLTNTHGVVIQPADRALLAAATGGQAPAVAKSLVAQDDDSEPAEVIRELEPALETDPDNVAVMTRLAWAYMRSLSVRSPIRTYRRSKAAVAMLERAIELEPANGEPRWLLFNFFLQAPAIVGGDMDEALVVAEALVEVDARRGYLALAKYHRTLGDEDQAERFRQRAEATAGVD